MSNAKKIKKKDVILTEEMKTKIRESGLMGFNLESTFKYVPRHYRKKNQKEKYDIPKELWPVFVLKGIDGVRSAEIEDSQKGAFSYKGKGTEEEVSVEIYSGKARIETLQEGIVSWSNFYDSEFNLIPTPKTDGLGKIFERSLKTLSPNLQIELANAITEQTKLTDLELMGLE